MPETKLKPLLSLESGIEKLERRPIDRYLLGPFLIWYGLRSRSMGRWPRRVLIAGGIYQVIYAWRDYRKLLGAAKDKGAGGVLDTIKNGTTNGS
jgi:hypothetical protein